ncbi:MAG TPA: four-carbon acid sugar kinase family protein [Baekduia sp.]|nr:four-carbon acid sugar kinase family protein [Baekduia sp.]
MATLVLADDLTGACDAALPFVTTGRRVRVGIRTPPREPADVTVVSTESRDLPAGPAADAVLRALSALPTGSGGATLLKKVDSRLRGPVAAELAAALRGSGRPYAVVTPALPRLDRIVEDGVLRAPGAPPLDIVSLLGGITPSGVATVSAADDAAVLAAAIETRGRQADVVVADARTDGELATLAAALAALHPLPLVAGSSGLAAAIAAQGAGGTGRSGPPVQPARRLLFVLGSLDPALRRQAQRLLAERPVAHVALGSRPTGPPASESVLLECVLDATASPDGGAKARSLARAAAALLREDAFDAVVCSGGAVAAAVCEELGVDALELLAEIGPGFAQARIAPDAGPPLLALRSGGFGGDNDLVEAFDRLSEEAS